MKRYNMKKFLVTCAVVALVGNAVLPATASAASCATQMEKIALNTRVLQTDLMVAALTCSQRSQYNNFVTKFKPVLIKNGKTLQAYFHRVYGGKSANELNVFITQIANDASTMSTRSLATEFCASSAALFEKTAKMKEKELDDLTADERFNRHGINTCTGEQFASKADKSESK